MKLAPGLLLVPLALFAVGCSSEDDSAARMDGLIDGVPVSEYEATTTVPSTTPTTTSTTVLPPATSEPPETTVPAEAVEPEAAAAPDLVAWRSATEAVCAEYEPRIRTIAAGLAPPDTLTDAAAWFDRLNPLTARYLRALVAVPLPEANRQDVEALYVLANDLKETARVAQAAAHFDDQPAYDLAATGLGLSGEAADELLLDLGVPACVAEEDGGTA